MIEKQNEERKQIQSRMREINASTNVEKVKTVYQKTIDEVKERLKVRQDFAEKFKAPNLKETLGGEDEEGDPGDEEGGEAGNKKESSPAVDYRKKFYEKEEEEFAPFYDLKKDDDFTEFNKKSKFWDDAKKKRFQIKKMKHLMKEYEETELNKIKESLKQKARTTRPQSEWIGESKPYPQPIKYEKGKPIYDPTELKQWHDDYKKQQDMLREREKKRFRKRDPDQEQKYQEHKKKEYDEMIKKMRSE